MSPVMKYYPTPVLTNAAEKILGPWTPRRHVLEGLNSLRPDAKAVGEAYTIRLRRSMTRSRANAARVLAAYDAAPPNCIVVVQLVDDVGGALLGDIIAHRLHKIGVSGVVVAGPVRDLEGLEDQGPALWYREAVTTGLETAETETEVQVALDIGSVTIAPGDIVVADRDGVFAIPRRHAEEFVRTAETIVEREISIHQSIEENKKLFEIFDLTDAINS